MSTPVLALLTVLLGPANAQEPSALENAVDRSSYAIGVDMARNFKREGIEFDMDRVIQGFKDAAEGRKLAISEAELSKAITRVQTDQRMKMAQNRGRKPAEINKRIGAEFLARNKTAPGVILLPSGLQYKVIKAGNGEKKPKEDDTVSLNYRTTGLDGTEYNCSNAGEPQSFKVKDLDTAAWREAVQLMTVGSKWQLFIPSQLAYGAGGVGSTVGPNQTLVAELELVAIK